MKFLEVYKRNKGNLVRWITFGCVALLFIFGIYRLYYTIPNTRGWAFAREAIKIGDTSLSFQIPYVDIDVIISIRLIFCIVSLLFILLVSYALIFVNKKISEFLIETESEMRKVYWPTFKEVLGSSVVIVITILILAFYLYLVDIGLDVVLKYIF